MMPFYIFLSLCPFMAWHFFQDWPLPLEQWHKFNANGGPPCRRAGVSSTQGDEG